MKTLTLLLVLFSAASFGQPKFQIEDVYGDFIPLSPIPYDGTLKIYDSAGKKIQDLLALEMDQNQLKAVFPDLSIESYLSKVNSEGKIEYSPVSISASKEDYSVVYDIAKFTTVLLTEPGKDCKIYGKVGVGIRIRADIKTRKKNVNVANLAGLGVSASNNKLKGGISFQIFGLEGKDIINLTPSSLTIDINSVNLALQAAATIKSRIYGEGVNLTPRIFAIRKDGCDAKEATSQILQMIY